MTQAAEPPLDQGIAASLCNLERLLLLATAAVLPLIYTPGLLNDPYDMGKLTLLISVASVALALRLAAATLGAPVHPLRTLLLPAGLVALAFVASWLGSDYKSWSLLGFYLRYAGLIPYLAVVTFAVLAADAFAGRGRQLLYALVGGATLVASYGILQMVFMGTALATRSDTSYVISTLGHSNFLGGYLAIVLPLALGMWGGRGPSSRVGMIATIILITCLIFTMSQGGWSAAIAGAAAFVALASRRRWQRRAGLSLAAAAGAASVGAVVVSMLVPHPTLRLPGVFATASSRGLLWEGALSVAMDRPVLGWGPNVHAIVGPINRVLEDALAFNFTKGDDAHSVPIAMFANVGLLGLAAWVFVVVWVWRSRRIKSDRSPMSIAAAAAVVAYVIQSLASIDEPTLRFVFWIVVAAIAAGTTARWKVRDAKVTRLRAMLASLIIIMGVAAAASAVRLLSGADYHVRQGVIAFSNERVEDGRIHFSAGLALRGDNEYKRRYAAALTEAALEQGSRGAPLIAEMKRTLSYLQEFPDAQALATYSKFLNRWSLYEPQANLEALTIARRAEALDPYNPLLAVDIADILLQLDRPDEAAAELAPFTKLLADEFPEYSDNYGEFWATVAMVAARRGEDAAARAALRRTPRSGTCRQILARELLKPRADQTRPPSLSFICPRTLTRLLP